jgi:hypothetical protein
MAKRVRSGSRPLPRRPVRRPAAGAPSPSGSTTGASANGRPVSADEPLDGEVLAAGPALDDFPRPTTAHLTDTELERAEQLQAHIAAQERAAMAEQIRRRQRVRAGLHEDEDVNAPLRVRAAKEYAYVARDVRRIVLTGALMVAILAVLAIAINVFGVIAL